MWAAKTIGETNEGNGSFRKMFTMTSLTVDFLS